MHKPAPKTNEISENLELYIQGNNANSLQYNLFVKELTQLQKADATSSYHLRGLLEKFHGNHEASIDFLKKAIRHQPNNAVLNFNLAKVIFDSSSHEDSIFYAKKALDNVHDIVERESYIYLYMCALIFHFRFNDVVDFYKKETQKQGQDYNQHLAILNLSMSGLEIMQLHNITEQQIYPIAECMHNALIETRLMIKEFQLGVAKSNVDFVMEIFLKLSVEQCKDINMQFSKMLDVANIPSTIRSLFQVKFLPEPPVNIQEEPTCPISGMTKAESIEISRALTESIRTRDYSNFELIEA